ncbi:threonine/serine exporter family protein [Streptomyces sp. NPDC060065]|uniref:threonine/serine exporter family protein n=1 Tax=Streptomyces sp. NPDC060065 TaxID=3347050 RepID=UPI00368DC2A4
MASAPSPRRLKPQQGRDLDLVLDVARILHANGERSERTCATADELARLWGLDVRIALSWDGVLAYDTREPAMRQTAWMPARPVRVNMARVTAVMQACELTLAGRLGTRELAAAVADADRRSAAGTGRFVVACASGAVALAVIFGAHRWQALMLIAASAALAGFVRRRLGRHAVGLFGQDFAAALIAGVIGACAVRWEVSSSLRLVALCPCMILVPGPHILNGCLDLLSRRITLGVARLGFALVTLGCIAAGVLAGLAAGGSSLPPVEPGMSPGSVMLASHTSRRPPGLRRRG